MTDDGFEAASTNAVLTDDEESDAPAVPRGGSPPDMRMKVLVWITKKSEPPDPLGVLPKSR